MTGFFIPAMKKLFGILFLLILLICGSAAYIVFTPFTAFDKPSEFLYVRSNEDVQQQVMQQAAEKNLFKYPRIFELAARQAKVWQRLKAGKFKVNREDNLLDILRMLRNNSQTPVKLVINRIRTKQAFAGLIGRSFEVDSLQMLHYITTADSLNKWDVTEEGFLSLIIPDTYEYYWTATTNTIFKKLKDAHDGFWETNNRLKQAENLGLSAYEVYVLASIVEEETNKNDEKGNIASVYYNRLNRGMPLGADPTIKFALNDFSLKRIYHKHLDVVSPYNTYRNKGLPPGPICTPSKTTIDATLNMPQTNYLFFVAQPGLTGYHRFSTNYAQHQQYAKEYQLWLNDYMK